MPDRAGLTLARATGEQAFVRDVKRALAARADARKAPGMQAYMRSAMPYHGVPTPELRRACRELFASHRFGDFASWRAAASGLWSAATHREERYVALELCAQRRYAEHQTLRALPMYERFIVEGAWWDYVDPLSRRLGEILRRQPAAMGKRMRAWARDRNLWKRRSAILCQLLFKDDTDLDLLYGCMEPSLESDEFFLRKAIGWALRDLAWTNPDEVVRYVRAHADRLSPLSKREALKNVVRSGRLRGVP